jgi:hypothetical protein
MFHFPRFAPRRRYPAGSSSSWRVSPFGHLRIKGYKPPPRSFSQVSHVLHRHPKPRHPPCTLIVSHAETYIPQSLLKHFLHPCLRRGVDYLCSSGSLAHQRAGRIRMSKSTCTLFENENRPCGAVRVRNARPLGLSPAGVGFALSYTRRKEYKRGPQVCQHDQRHIEKPPLPGRFF